MMDCIVCGKPITDDSKSVKEYDGSRPQHISCWQNPAPVEANKEQSTYMDAMDIVLKHIHGSWPPADIRTEIAKDIQALVDKAVVAELKNIKTVPGGVYPEGNKSVLMVIAQQLEDRLSQLGAKDE